jgi:D-amino-acid dehydrogenase
MHVVVLGAGVVGVTTAYYLTERGHTVTVVDQAGEVASGASGGNGGQLSYSFTDAMASPALLAKLPRVISGLDPAFCVRPPIDTLPVRWGLDFLSQCTSQRARSNTLAVLQMAMRSSSLMAELRSQVPGCDVQVITPEQATEIEPALAFIKTPFAGAVYSENDEVGDVLSFTSQLGQWLTGNRNTEFQFNTTIHRIITEGGKLHAVETSNGTLKPDAVVVCLGAWSDQVLKPLGIRANIYPVRGYSVTLPAGEKSNSVSITDLGSKMVYSRLGDQIRIAGFADFIGFKTDRDEDRQRELLDAARNFAPDIADFDVSSVNEWGGYRPMTPNSRPLVGPTPVEGLYLNTGHGMLGWTLACVSGHDLAALL